MERIVRGSEGAAVRFAQERLGALGFGPVDPSGVADAATIAAVTALQEAAGLDATGEVDDATWDALLSTETSAGPQAFSDTPEDDPFATVSPGDEGDAVWRLKSALLALGYTVPTTPTFDDGTRRVVAEFQAANSLPATGEVQEDTWIVLFEAVSNLPVIESFAETSAFRDVAGKGGYRYRQWEDGAVAIIGSPTGSAAGAPMRSGAAWQAITAEIGAYPAATGFPITTGRRGADVAALQKRLNALGFGPLDEDGIYGKDCVAAVTRFQVAAALPQTGAVDATTNTAILTPRATLAAGAPKEELRRCQERLQVLGHGPLSADGLWGSITSGAVSKFQTADHLPVTGTIDERTWGRLYAVQTAAVPAAVVTADTQALAALAKAGVAAHGADADKVLKVIEGALTWVGKKESPKGSNGGPDIDAMVSGYYSAAQEKESGKPPWCALAVSYWLKQGLACPDYKSTPMKARYGGAAQFQEWGKKNGRFLPATGTAPAGAVFVMSRDGSGSDAGGAKAGHVGMIVAEVGDSVRTVEGNVSDSVAARTRKKSELLGYIRWW